MSEIFQIAIRSKGGQRMAAAFKSMQAAVILKLAYEGAGLVHEEFTKAVCECVVGYAALLENATEERFLSFAGQIQNLMQYEEIITKAVIDAEDRIADEEEKALRAENKVEGAE